jgi:hypothetical protein
MSVKTKKGDDAFKYVVIVDSRDRSTSDLEAYKEYTCSVAHYENLIVNHYNNICVASDVAKLCGLDLKVYFYDPINFGGRSSLSSEHSNGIATLLTFNPATGHCKNTVHGKAYVVWDNGDLPLSKRQVWGVQELIKEARNLYMAPTCDHMESTLHHIAQKQLLKWCDQHRSGTWGPHSLYETRKLDRLYQGNQYHGGDKSGDLRDPVEERDPSSDGGLTGASEEAGKSRTRPEMHHHKKYEVCQTNPYEKSPVASIILPTTEHRLQEALYANH